MEALLSLSSFIISENSKTRSIIDTHSLSDRKSNYIFILYNNFLCVDMILCLTPKSSLPIYFPINFKITEQ